MLRIQADMHDGLCKHGLPVHFNTAQRRNLVCLAGSGPERTADTFAEYLATASLAHGDHDYDSPVVCALNSARNVGADVEFWRDVCKARHHKPTHRHVTQQPNSTHTQGFFTALACLAESLNADDSVAQSDWNAAARTAARLCVTSHAPRPPLSQLTAPQPTLPKALTDGSMDEEAQGALASALVADSLAAAAAAANSNSGGVLPQAADVDVIDQPREMDNLAMASYSLSAALQMEGVFTPAWIAALAKSSAVSRAFIDDVTRRSQMCA